MSDINGFGSGVFKIGFWLVFLTLLVATVMFTGRVTSITEIVSALLIAFVIGHAIAALGWTDALAFVIICLFVTLVIENIGTATGFPFGHYKFLIDPDLPHIGSIPIIVGPLYVGMGYPSWVIANLLSDGHIERPKDRFQLFTVPVLAAFIMVQWDAVMDPTGSTLTRAWVWYESGGYFGVPLSNFLGWFLVTYIYFQLFSCFLYLKRKNRSYASRSSAFWAIPVLLYLAAGLCHIPPMFDVDAQLIDAGHKAWSAADLRETTVVVAFCTMLPTSLLALFRLVRLQNKSS